MSISAGSLDGGGVAGGVSTACCVEDGVGIAATAFGVSVGAAGDCFGVQGGVGSAAWLGVGFAGSLRGGVDVGTAVSVGVDFDDFFDARYFSVASIQGHVGEYSQCFV